MPVRQDRSGRKRKDKRRPVGRKRIVRKVDLVVKEGKVLDMPPGWKFTVSTDRFGDLTFDFEPLRETAREDLAKHLRDAFWSLRHLSGETLKAMRRYLIIFFRFLDMLEEEGLQITRLDQVDRHVLDLYLSWLDNQVCSVGPNKGEKWRVKGQRATYSALKAVLVERMKRVPGAVSPQLDFPKNPHPLSNQIPPRPPYTEAEHLRLVEACHRDLERYHTTRWEEPDHQVLAIHLLSLALGSGGNRQSLLEIRRGREGLSKSPIPGRVLLKLVKYRGYTTQVSSFPKADKPLDPELFDSLIPADLEEHFESLCQHTEPLIEAARPEDKQCAFLYLMKKGNRQGQVVRWSGEHAKDALRAFANRHDLRDDQGSRLSIGISRIRVTFGTQLYEKTRDLLQVSRRMGHKSIRTTQRHYVHSTPKAKRNFSLSVCAMAGWVSSKDSRRAEKLSRDLDIPVNTARELLQGSLNNMICRCRSPRNSDGGECEGWWSCFGCDSMVVFEDDLWRLYSCYYSVLNLQKKLGEHIWTGLYGHIIRIIDQDIAPEFSLGLVEKAKRKARNTPHSAWPISECESL